MKRAQEEFERQIEITKLLLEGLGSAQVSFFGRKHFKNLLELPFLHQANHVRCLNDFVTQQIEFYNQCYRHMLNLQREISYSNNSHRAASFSGSTTSSTAEGLHHHHHHLPSVYPSLSPASALSPTNNATQMQSPSRGGSVSPSLSSVRHSTANVNANTPSASVLDSTTSSSSQQPATLNCSEQLSFPPRPSPTSSVDSSSHQLLMSSSSNCEGVNYQHFSHPNASATSVAGSGSGGGSGGKRRARALNDYVPLEVGELSLRADEIIHVEHSSALDPAHMMGERTTESGSVERGKVPVAYLEILN